MTEIKKKELTNQILKLQCELEIIKKEEQELKKKERKALLDELGIKEDVYMVFRKYRSHNNKHFLKSFDTKQEAENLVEKLNKFERGARYTWERSSSVCNEDEETCCDCYQEMLDQEYFRSLNK